MIDPESLREDLRQLVELAPVGGTPGEAEVQRWMAARLGEAGLTVDRWPLDLPALRADAAYPGEEVDRTEAWGCVGTRGDDPALILAGHVDVVPGSTNRLSERDGRWFGRGTCDMLSGVAAILAAARSVRDVPLSRGFAVHSVIGEEDGGLGAFATLRRGHSGAACVIAEPTGGEVVNANAGSLTFRIEVAGVATHGSTRWAGRNAIDALPDLLAALRHLEARRNAAPPTEFAHLPIPFGISVGIVRAGDWASTVPDLLVVEGRYGVRPGESLARAQAELEAAVAPHAVTWTGGRFAPGATDTADPFVGQVVAITTGATAGAPYGSDLRQYVAAGIPTVQYGPGDPHEGHSEHESVAIDDVVRCAEIYRELILTRCR